MFARIHLQMPGLEKVQAALDHDDLRAAETAYFEFWKSRTDQKILWNPHFRMVRLEGRNGQASDYFLAPVPRTISWRDRERLQDRIYKGNAWEWFDKQTNWTLLEMADLMLEDRMVPVRDGHSFLPPLDMGNPWNWDSESELAPSANALMHRHYFVARLAQAYWLTGDDNYVTKLVTLWTDWIRRASAGRKNQGLAPMYQAFIHPGALEMILDSPTLEPEAFCLMVAYLSESPIKWLTRGPRGANQTIGQVNAILSLVAALPEFKGSDRWLKTAMGYLTGFYNGSTYPDGGFAEPSFLYSISTALALLNCADNLLAAGLPVPQELSARATGVNFIVQS